VSIAMRSLALVGLMTFAACGAPAAAPPSSEPPVASGTPPPAPTATVTPTHALAPTASPTTTTPSPTDTSSPNASPTLEPNSRTGPRLALVGDQAVFEPSLFGEFSATLAAAHFVAGNTHHAYVVAFSDIPGQQQAFHVTSADGVGWEVDPSDPFADLGVDMSPPGPIPGSIIRLPDRTWTMYLWGIPLPQENGGVIWRATSDSPAGPWVADPVPALDLGAAGAWDDRALDFPSVVATEDGFEMIYSAVGNADLQTSSIGLASSTDGIEWTKHPDPVLEAGACSADPARYAAMPRLLDTEDGYLLFFETDSSVAAARSTDLLNWTCVVDGPVLAGSDIPGSDRVHSFAVAQDGTRITALVESLVEGGSEMWFAEAVDFE